MLRIPLNGKARALAPFLGLGAVLGCTGTAADTLTVFAAASLTESFSKLGEIFEAENPGVRVRFNFTGSQHLALQIAEGARADLFASADHRWMNQLVGRGFAADSPLTFAQNRLVVIVASMSSDKIRTLSDLTVPGIKVVLGTQATPIGYYTRQVINQLGASPDLTDSFPNKVLANLVSEEETVKGVVAKVQLGEADAGIVYQSDISSQAGRTLKTLEIPDEYNVKATYPAAILSSAHSPALARRFLDLLFSDAGQQVLGEFGFVPLTSDLKQQ